MTYVEPLMMKVKVMKVMKVNFFEGRGELLLKMWGS